MSAGHPRREPHWLYDKAQRQIKRREDLAEFERIYRKEAGLPEGPLDLLDHVGLELALKTHELFMDRVFWGEGAGELTGFLPSTQVETVRKLAWYDPRPPMEPNPSLAAYIEAMYQEATVWFEGGESPIMKSLRDRQLPRGSNGWSADATWFDDVTDWSHIQVVPQGVPRQEVNLSRETMDLLASALDTTLEHYGTSEHTDPRGYWMKLDVESADQRRDTDTEA